MPDFSCDANVISAFTPCGVVLFRCLQYMNEIYKNYILICLHKSDVIKLTSFSAKNLLEDASVTLV